jgi:hypothetical protein
VIDDERLEQALRQAPTWEPPEGFARMVGKRAALEVSRTSPEGLFQSFSVSNAATRIALAATAGFVGAQVLETFQPAIITTDPNQPIAWAWVLVSYLTALLIVRQARASRA